MSAKKFFKETEPAVKHMFAALEHYNGLNPPRKEYFKKNGCAQARKEVIKFLGRSINAMGLDMAKASLCGAIIEISYSLIKHRAVRPLCIATFRYNCRGNRVILPLCASWDIDQLDVNNNT